MASTNVIHPTVACAEYISLLHLLHSVPSLPSSNPLNNLLHQDGYTLSFKREHYLVGTLAFLSNTKDDPNHIPALCVKEDPDSVSLNVLLAVNRANWNSGRQALRGLNQGFDRIFAILSEVEDRYDAQNTEDDIFTEIISMCSSRILCRLRFTQVGSNRRTPKQPIKKALQEAISSLANLGNERLGEGRLPVATSFTRKAKHVIMLADKWTNHQTSSRLKDLVEGIYCMKQIEGLTALINFIPNIYMAPSARKSMLNIVTKVARYREAARFLYRTAKRFPLVRRMKVVIANLPEEAFIKAPAKDYTLGLVSTVARINAGHQNWDLNHLCRLMKTSQEEANEQFITQTRKTLKDSKIHAEIQLVYFCELNAFELPPRVICSSKDACFLCNAFIGMHGKMHIPRHHGRLYPAWRLPLLPKLYGMGPRFNSALEDSVRRSVMTLFVKRQKTFYPDPNESTLLTLYTSTTSSGGSALSNTSIALSGNVAPSDPSTSPIGRPTPSKGIQREEKALPSHSTEETTTENSVVLQRTQTNSIPVDNLPRASTVSEEAISTVTIHNENIEPSNQDVPQLDFPSSSHSQLPPLQITANDDEKLIQGKLVSGSVSLDRKSGLHTAGAFEIFMEYPTSKLIKSPDNTFKEIGYEIEWLLAEEGKKVLEDRTAAIIDIESLPDGILPDLDGQKGIFVSAQGVVVKILVQPCFG